MSESRVGSGSAGSLIRGTGLIFAGRILDMAVLFLFAVATARLLGPAGAGAYRFLTAYTGLWALLIDYGLQTLIVREVGSRSRESAAGVVRAALVLKVPLALLTCLLMVVPGWFLRAAPSDRLALGLFAVAMVAGSFATFCAGVLQGLHQLGRMVLIRLLSSLCTVALGLGLLGAGLGIPGLALASAVGQLGAMGLGLWWIAREGMTRPPPGDIPTTPAWLFRESAAFFLFAAASSAYLLIDGVLLGHYAGDSQLGFYAAATRLAIAVLLFGESFFQALYPAMISAYRQGREPLEYLYSRATWAMFLCGVPATVGLALVGRPLVALCFGARFLPGGEALVLLSPIVVVGFVAAVPSTLFTVVGRQGLRTTFALVMLGIEVVLSVWLVPRFGFAGSCVALLGVNLFSVLAHFVAARRLGFRLGCRPWSVLGILASAAIMALAVRACADAGLVVGMVVGAVTYAVACLLTGAVTRRDLEALRALRRPASPRTAS